MPHPTLLRNLFHFLSFRLDAHAQKEIRLYAQAMAEIVRKVTPVAYEDFVLESLSFSQRERIALREVLDGRSAEAACESAGLPLRRADGTPMKSGEGVEFLEKVHRLRASGAPGAEKPASTSKTA